MKANKLFLYLTFVATLCTACNTDQEAFREDEEYLQGKIFSDPACIMESAHVKIFFNGYGINQLWQYKDSSLLLKAKQKNDGVVYTAYHINTIDSTYTVEENFSKEIAQKYSFHEKAKAKYYKDYVHWLGRTCNRYQIRNEWDYVYHRMRLKVLGTYKPNVDYEMTSASIGAVSDSIFSLEKYTELEIKD